MFAKFFATIHPPRALVHSYWKSKDVPSSPAKTVYNQIENFDMLPFSFIVITTEDLADLQKKKDEGKKYLGISKSISVAV